MASAPLTMHLIVAHAPRHHPRDLRLERTVARVAVVPGARTAPMTVAVFVKSSWSWTVEGSSAGARPPGGAPSGPSILAPSPAVSPWVKGDLEEGNGPAIALGGAREARLVGEPARPVAVQWQSPEGLLESVELPTTRPRLFVVTAQRIGDDRELEARLHCATVDRGRRTIDLVHRAEAPVLHPEAADVDSLVLAFATDEDWQEEIREARWSPSFRELPRGHFERASTREEAEAQTDPPPLSDAEVAMARYSTWGYELPPSPTMTLARFARIQAELAEEREPREKVLERHGLTEYEWSVEEIAGADLLGRPPGDEPGADRGDDDPTMAESYAELFAAEQARLEAPGEAQRPLESYARIVARMERGDPRRALNEEGIGLGAWMRLERRMMSRQESDPAFAAALERALGVARADVAAEGPPPGVAPGGDEDGDDDEEGA